MLVRITTHLAFSTVYNAITSLRSFAATAAELRTRDDAIRVSRRRSGAPAPAHGAGAGAGAGAPGAGASPEHYALEDEELLELAAEIQRELFGDGDAGDVAEGGCSATEGVAGAGAGGAHAPPALDEGGVLNLL
jgi:hypothetical protein